jgi:hypothetical protein
MPDDILKPGIRTPLFFVPSRCFPSGTVTINGTVPGCGRAPAQKGEAGPAFLSINEQVCYCLFLKHKMEIPGTYLSQRFRMECVG